MADQVFPMGSQLISDINKALLNVSETGTLREVENKMLERQKSVDDDHRYHQNQDTSSISFANYWALFILTGGTSTVSLVVYVVHCCTKIEDTMFGHKTIWKLMSALIKHRKWLSRKVSKVETIPTNLP
ncbi:hypothetical protein Ddye_026680 [Dipteronia dyeriana]|uniref:Uncharacterized protein n=1 Tax=Dipteronia dyeriana TaxID=168575 RepID=A0AAD9TMP9_9ROSI|nr:hypothetical protein Ddye_026680 [Dipteronia dyeriana]